MMKEAGNVSRIVSFEHLKELKEELKMQHDNGYFSEDFYKERLTSFKFNNPTSSIVARSIIIIAVPQPTIILIFRWNGTDQQVIIPPTYDFSANIEIFTLASIVSPYREEGNIVIFVLTQSKGI